MAADPTRVAETRGAEAESTTKSTSGVSRRGMLAGAAAGSAAGLAGCTRIFGDESAASGETLTVCVWSGNYAERFKESVVPMYEDEHDVTLQVETGWNNILANIRQSQGNPPYDVTVTDGNFYYRGRQGGLFESIRTENVPHLEEAIDYYSEFRPTEYGMPVDGAPCNIIYREDLDFEPSEWADLSSSAVENSRGIGIDTGFWWFPVHAAAIGMDDQEAAGELYDESLHDEVFDEIRNWNVQSWASSGQDIWQAFESGTIDVAQWYFEQTAYDIGDYDGLTHTLPEKTTGYLNHWCVTSGTDKRDRSEEFIDFLMRSDVQTEWSKSSPALFCNADMEYANDLGEQLPTSAEEAQNIAFPDWEQLMDYYDEFESEYASIRNA
ncbi:ABC transporter substrate-binding protein [Halostagnicola kamekurae]|nr:extracellular solute-binding protein [Halostagnicola kamekurae]